MPNHARCYDGIHGICMIEEHCDVEMPHTADLKTLWNVNLSIQSVVTQEHINFFIIL